MDKDCGIDAATWSRVNPLLDAALDLPPAQRAGWLATLPPQHADLKTLLHELLDRAANVETNTLLKALPALDTHDAAATDALASRHAAGDVIGPYRLVRPIGVGGMAEVWLADRADGLMQRSVALKLPFGPFQGDLAARIAREREILATLDHPHIARLYDAGVAPDGQPYLALEHVDGQRIESSPKWQRERMRAWALIGFVQLDQSAPAEAIASFERALKEFERLESRVTPARADALLGLGRAHLAQGEPAQALPLLEQAEHFWRAFDPASRSAAVASEWLARARAARPG